MTAERDRVGSYSDRPMFILLRLLHQSRWRAGPRRNPGQQLDRGRRCPGSASGRAGHRADELAVPQLDDGLARVDGVGLGSEFGFHVGLPPFFGWLCAGVTGFSILLRTSGRTLASAQLNPR